MKVEIQTPEKWETSSKPYYTVESLSYLLCELPAQEIFLSFKMAVYFPSLALFYGSCSRLCYGRPEHVTLCTST
jgi:hypothetical protein